MSRPISQPHKTGHRYALTRLSSYMDGQLSAPEKARVRAHLDTCPDCRQELRTLRWTKDLARQVPVLPVPRSFIVREVDLEPRSVAQPRLGFARSLAGLQAAAAIVAVLLVLVVAGDLYLGTSFRLNRPAPAVARQELAPEASALSVPAAPETTLDETTVGQQVKEPENPPELKRVLAPTETVAQHTTPPIDPTPEPSPTWTTPPTRTPTPVGFSGEITSTKHSPTPQPTLAATVAPSPTATVEPSATPVPTETQVPIEMAAPVSTAEPMLAQEAQPIAQVPETTTLKATGMEEDQRVEPIPPQEPVDQRLGWRVAQAGLGIVLLGLLIAIIWLRLKQ